MRNQCDTLPKRFFSADSYERHYIVASFLRGADVTHILEVGGSRGCLCQFVQPHQLVVVVNVDDSGDVCGSGDRLPFADKSFDAVASMDTLEHVKPAQRAAFVGELRRVAKKRLVLCAPLGTPQHQQVEERMQQFYRQRGVEHRWLGEHLENGLPTVEEVCALFEGVPYDLFFYGDCRSRAARVRLEKSLPQKLPRKVRHALSLLLNLSLDRLLHRYPLRSAPSPYTNRFYVVCWLEGK